MAKSATKPKTEPKAAAKTVTPPVKKPEAQKPAPIKTLPPGELKFLPLHQLQQWDGNVRKSGASENIEELEASILSRGVVTSLVGRKKGEKVEIGAGQRRLLASNNLLAKGKVGKEFLLPIQIYPATLSDNDFREISLAENVVRQQLHPLDLALAIKDMRKAKASDVDIGARFGVSETVVRKRAALADAATGVQKALRAGEISLEEAHAFTSNPDHKVQEKVLKSFRPDWNDADWIRRVLNEKEIEASDKRVKFVTLAAYEKAGGKVRKDLFLETDEEGEGIYIEDAALLNKLVKEKLERSVASVKSEGWKWVEHRAEGFDYSYKQKFGQLQAERKKRSPEHEAELKRLQKEFADLEKAWNNEDDDEKSDKLRERMDPIEDRIEELENTKEFYPPEALKNGGAFVSIGNNGKTEIERGFIRKEDQKALAADKKAAGKSVRNSNLDKGKEKSKVDEEPSFSQPLNEELTARRQSAVAESLMKSPDIAFRQAVYALARDYFGGYDGAIEDFSEAEHDAPIDIKVKEATSAQGFDKKGDCKAWDALEQAKQDWIKKIPHDTEKFYNWCMTEERITLDRLFAYLVARGYDDKHRYPETKDSPRNPVSIDLHRRLNVDVSLWYKPDAKTFFHRVSRPIAIKAIAEARGSAVTAAEEKLKKDGLAELAAKAVSEAFEKGKPWLPELLRHPAAAASTSTKK